MKSAPLFESAGISNENDEWYTPSWLFRALGVTFDLDPCSPGAPPSSVPAARHLTKADNGLTAPWHGNIWLNPPFSSKRPWYERLVQHGTGIALMPARTETHDLQDYMSAADALLFLRGRIYFERGHRPGANRNGCTTTPPSASCSAPMARRWPTCCSIADCRESAPTSTMAGRSNRPQEAGHGSRRL